MIVAASSRSASPYLMACLGGLLLLIYVFVNGVPFFYPDAFVYFYYGESAWEKLGSTLPDFWWATAPSGGVSPEAFAPLDELSTGNTASVGTGGKDNWTPRAGRSVYYGLLSALPGIFSPPWNGVILQAYCSALTVAFAWRAAAGAVGAGYLVAMAALGVLSTFGIFASTAMPDVWAAVGILAVAVLVAARDRIGRIDRIVLWGLVLFAALAHSSHLLVLGILVVLFGVLRAAKVAPIAWVTIGKLFAVLVAAVGLEMAAQAAIARAAGNQPLGLPFLTAHLVDGGPGMDFIRDACPDAGFAVCEGADRLPVEWREFLFRFSVPLDYQRRLVDEDASFALATLRHDPLAVIGLALRDAARQTVMIGLVTTPIRSAIGERAAAEQSSAPLAQRVRAGRLYDADWLYRFLSITNMALVLAGLAALGFVATRPDLGTRAGGLRPFLVVSITGLLLNAAVCGVLASPYDRFQARVAWLVPVLAIIALAAYSQDRRLYLRGRETRYS